MLLLLAATRSAIGRYPAIIRLRPLLVGARWADSSRKFGCRETGLFDFKLSPYCLKLLLTSKRDIGSKKPP